MIKAEISLYPISPEDVNGLADLTSQFLAEHSLDYDSYLGSTSLNTTIRGSPEHVWSAVRHLFEENQKSGYDVVMVTTLTNWE